MFDRIGNMSFFPKPIMNKKPQRTVNLLLVYLLIRSDYYKAVIELLRAIIDKKEQNMFKGKYLDYITPSGIFTYDNDASLVKHSNILCVDLDDLTDVEQIKQSLINDENFETLLAFRSPCGYGLKWFIAIDLNICDHKSWYAAVRNYLMTTYGLSDHQVDKSCSNVSRACYMSYDPEAYINKEIIKIYNSSK
jgi:hypothetical protein